MVFIFFYFQSKVKAYVMDFIFGTVLVSGKLGLGLKILTNFGNPLSFSVTVPEFGTAVFLML